MGVTIFKNIYIYCVDMLRVVSPAHDCLFFNCPCSNWIQLFVLVSPDGLWKPDGLDAALVMVMRVYQAFCGHVYTLFWREPIS